MYDMLDFDDMCGFC